MSENISIFQNVLSNILNDVASMSVDVIKKSSLQLQEVERVDTVSAENVGNDICTLLERIQANVNTFVNTYNVALDNYKTETEKEKAQKSPKPKLSLSLKKSPVKDTDIDLTNSDNEGDQEPNIDAVIRNLESALSFNCSKEAENNNIVKDEDSASDTDSEKTIHYFDVNACADLEDVDGSAEGLGKALQELENNPGQTKVETTGTISNHEMSFDFDEYDDDFPTILNSSQGQKEEDQRENDELLVMLNEAVDSEGEEQSSTDENKVDMALRLLEEECLVLTESDSDMSFLSDNEESHQKDGHESDDEESEEEAPLIELKNCDVSLKRVDELDDTEIDRLCKDFNLNKRKCEKALGRVKRRVKRRRIASTSSDSSSRSSTCDLITEEQGQLTPDFSNIGINPADSNALADELADRLDDDAVSFGFSSNSSESDDQEPKKDQNRQKPDEKKNEDPNDKVDKSASSDEEDLDLVVGMKKKGSWRNDLFFGTSSESDDSGVSEKLPSKDDDVQVLEDEEDSKEKVKLKFLNGETIAIVGSSDSSDDDVTIVDEEESPGAKGGRRNIRAILSDDELDFLTQRAKNEEDERIMRLEEHSKTLESLQSQREDFVLDVDTQTNTPLITVDYNLSQMLKPHQKDGVKFMWEACYESVEMLKKKPGTGCILAHCMGLGKTLQVITLIHTLFKHEATRTRHVLIICPLSTVMNWQEEFNNALGRCSKGVKIRRTFIVGGMLSDKLEQVKQWRAHSGVLVMGYDTFTILVSDEKMRDRVSDRDKEDLNRALLRPGPDLIVCDEGHLLKNDKTLRNQAFMKVITKRRIALTGTPMQNNLKEYYFMVQFVKPHLLGTFTEFSNRFATPIKNGQYHDSTPEDIKLMKKRTHVLTKLLKKTIHRVEVSVLAEYLPELIDYSIFVKLSPLQVEIYKQYIAMVTGQSRDLAKGFLNDVRILSYNNLHPYTLLLHYSKAARKRKKILDQDDEHLVDDDNHVNRDWYKNLLPEDVGTNVEYSSKLRCVLNIVEQCGNIGEKLLIFSQNIVELDTLEHFLRLANGFEKGVHYYRMDGSTKLEDRSRMCNSFNNNPTSKVFLLTHRVGGLGLNLVGASRVIMLGSNHNPSLDTQSMYRVYRFGQEKKCFVYRLLSLATMEEKIYHRCVVKLHLSGTVVDKMHFVKKYTSTDLQAIYRIDFSEYGRERPIPVVPSDKLLGTLVQRLVDIYRYLPHNSLLENRPEEELDDEDKASAWEEFNRIEKPVAPLPVLNPVSLNAFSPMMFTNRWPRPGPGLLSDPASGVRPFLPRNLTNNAPRIIMPQGTHAPYPTNSGRRPNGLLDVIIPSSRDIVDFRNTAASTLYNLMKKARESGRPPQGGETPPAPSAGEFNYALNKVL